LFLIEELLIVIDIHFLTFMTKLNTHTDTKIPHYQITIGKTDNHRKQKEAHNQQHPGRTHKPLNSDWLTIFQQICVSNLYHHHTQKTNQ